MMMFQHKKKFTIWVMTNIALLLIIFWGWAESILMKTIPEFSHCYWATRGYDMTYRVIWESYPNNLFGQSIQFLHRHVLISPSSVSLLISVLSVLTWMVLFFIQILIINAREERKVCLK